jgi:hypothetical protein
MRLRSNPFAAAAAAPRALGLAALLAAAAAQAGTASYQGEFVTDDQLFVTQFVLPADEVVSATTLGYGGGINGAGLSIAAGGFAPVLSLFLDGYGLVDIARGSSRVCGPGAGNADPVSGFCWDAGFSAMRTAGHYTLVLSQDGNEPLGLTLAEGYTQTGQPDYTGLAYLGQAGAPFTQVDGQPRTGRWALDVQAAAVPEPEAWLLMLLGVGALVLRRTGAGSRD